MIKGYTYINLSLFPVYVNDAHSSTMKHIGIQRYNSSQWMSYTNDQDLDTLHTLVRLSNDDVQENLSNDYYDNFQLITDLFDIILTRKSEFRSKDFNESIEFRSKDFPESIDYMLRKKCGPIDLLTDNRYTAEFSMFHPQNNTIVLIANPASENCRELINKRQRLNECL